MVVEFGSQPNLKSENWDFGQPPGIPEIRF